MSEQPSAVEKLRQARAAFAAAAKNGLEAFDRQIAEAEHAEAQRLLNEAFQQFLPGSDKSVLSGHAFIFMVNKSQDMGEGIFGALGTTLRAAHKIHTTVSGIKDVDVSARLWGNSAGELQGVQLGDRGKVDNASGKITVNAKYFLPAAKEILVSNTPDKATHAQKHYIIVCDGNIADNADQTAALLSAAAQFNPKATFDFIVFGASAGKIGELVEKCGIKKTSLVTVSAPADITDAVMRAVKGRLAESVPAPVPQQRPAAAKAGDTPAAPLA